MKKILIAVVLLSCVIAGCKKVKTISYAGVYKLNKQIVSDGKWDTTWMKQQEKIYTDRYYMYSGLSTDSDSRFGFGTYEIGPNHTIVEHNIFNYKALDSAQVFVVQMKQNANGLTATVPDWARSGTTGYKLTEDYSKAPSSAASALDGVWELDKLYLVKGRDTTRQRETLFKLFWQGHFMLIRRYPVDPVATKYENGFSYGKFTLENNALDESIDMSGQNGQVNKNIIIPVDLKTTEYTEKFNDPDTHQQTISVYKKIRGN